MISEKYIAELLFHHECVIIPGFGGFIGNYEPAKINQAQHRFTPPFRSLLFNINLKQNDGLLANHIAARETLSFDDAMTEVRILVESWKQKLGRGEPVILERIGKFTADREGNLQFAQDPEVNYLPESFGLSPFISPPIRRGGLQKKMERRITRYIDSTAGYRYTLPKQLKWAAILAIPIGITALLGVMNMERIKDLSGSYSGFFYTSTPPSFAKPAAVDKRTFIITPDKLFRTTSIPHIRHSDPAFAPADHTSGIRVKAYSIIVGAFQVKENADNLVVRLTGEGYGAFILDVTRGGLHRVCIQSYSDRNEALQQLAEIRSKEFASAWLLQK